MSARLQHWLFITTYRLLFAPFMMLVYLVFVVPLFRKPRKLFRLRRTPYRRAKRNPNDTTIWVHAASGEFEYAKPVIRQIKEKAPNTFVIVTYSSPSYADAIKAYKWVDQSQPLPLDLAGPISSFINENKPCLALLARSDLWPEMLYQLEKRRIPTAVFATSFHQNPNWLSRFWKKMNLQMISLFFLNRKEDEKVLQGWGLNKKIFIHAGDPRFDEAFFRKANPRAMWGFSFPSDLPTLVLGSTWPEDEEVILGTSLEMVKKCRINLILAPHETTEAHLQTIKSQIKNRGLEYSLLSTLDAQTKKLDAPILLVDKVGHLADLYSKGTVAFVGGSFRKRVHSVMEPLAQGLLTLVGPYHLNNPESLVFKQLQISGSFHAVEVINSEKDFQQILERVLASSEYLKFQELITKAAQSHCGASEIIVEELLRRKLIPGEKNVRI